VRLERDKDAKQDHEVASTRDCWSAAVRRSVELFRNEFDPAADVVGRLGLCDVGVIAGNMAQNQSDDLIVTLAASDVAALASDLP
jgi:hypothetical protein